MGEFAAIVLERDLDGLSNVFLLLVFVTYIRYAHPCVIHLL